MRSRYDPDVFEDEIIRAREDDLGYEHTSCGHAYCADNSGHIDECLYEEGDG